MSINFENSALVLNAERLSNRHDWNPNFKFFIGLHFLEVEMEIFVCDRISLNLLQKREGLLGLARLLELDKDRTPGNDLQEANKLRGINGKFFWFRVLPVENCRDGVGFTNPARCAATGLRAWSDSERELCFHGFGPPETPGIGGRRSGKGLKR